MLKETRFRSPPPALSVPLAKSLGVTPTSGNSQQPWFEAAPAPKHSSPSLGELEGEDHGVKTAGFFPERGLVNPIRAQAPVAISTIIL